MREFSFLEEGGPHNVRRIGNDSYELSIGIGRDSDGMRASQCPNEECAPRLFKVRPGTGLTGTDAIFCPYCRQPGTPQGFVTDAQRAYAIEVMKGEALKGVHRMLGDALGISPGGTRTVGGGFITMKLSVPRPRLMTPGAPREEEVRRDTTCPLCGLEQAVFGFAIWCADCGEDIFLRHVGAELDAVRATLNDLERRRSELGSRVAAKDLENALEDAVSIFEAGLKVTVRRFLLAGGKAEAEVSAIVEKEIKTAFQSTARAEKVFRRLTGAELFHLIDQGAMARARIIFEKRHAITHNAGVADDRFLERTGLAGRGRDVRTTETEVRAALKFAERVVASAYRGLFPSAWGPSSPLV